MKSIITLFTLLLAFAIQVQAQQITYNPEEVATKEAMEMVKALDLSDDQIEQVREILYANELKKYKIIQEKPGDIALLEGVQLEKQEALQEVLNDEQLEKWYTTLEEQKKLKEEQSRRDN